jgi:hypothetical protein
LSEFKYSSSGSSLARCIAATVIAGLSRWLTLLETFAHDWHPERPDKMCVRRTFTILLHRKQRHFQGVLEPGYSSSGLNFAASMIFTASECASFATTGGL